MATEAAAVLAGEDAAKGSAAAAPTPPTASLLSSTNGGLRSALSSLTGHGAPPLRFARALVSGSKRRTQVDGHDLDLTYITPRLIALGLPASGLEALYRNPLADVRAFLDAKHASHYAMVNLCNERDYADADWPAAACVMRFPYADHHTCCMSALHAFCERLDAFLAADERRIAAVHCKAGKGRTGVMIAAYLLRCGAQLHPQDALKMFRATRTTDDDAVNNPSQARYVHHYGALLAAPPEERPQLLAGEPITLLSITLSSAPSALFALSSTPQTPAPVVLSRAEADGDGGGGGDCGGGAAAGNGGGGGGGIGGVASLASLVVPSWNLEIAISCLSPHQTTDGVASHRVPICVLGPLKCAPAAPGVRFEVPNGGLRVRGDVLLSLRSAAGMVTSAEELGWAHLHTSWMPGAPTAGTDSSGSVASVASVAVLGRSEVDLVDKDSRFPPDWQLQLHYAADEHGAAPVTAAPGTVPPLAPVPVPVPVVPLGVEVRTR